MLNADDTAKSFYSKGLTPQYDFPNLRGKQRRKDKNVLGHTISDRINPAFRGAGMDQQDYCILNILSKMSK